MGYAIAVVLGVPLSILVAFSEVLRRTFYPAAVTLEMVPKIAFAPGIRDLVRVFLCRQDAGGVSGLLFSHPYQRHIRLHLPEQRAAALQPVHRRRPPCARSGKSGCQRPCPRCSWGSRERPSTPPWGATIAEWIGGNAGLGYYIQVALQQFQHGAGPGLHIHAHRPGTGPVPDGLPCGDATDALARIPAVPGADMNRPAKGNGP